MIHSISVKLVKVTSSLQLRFIRSDISLSLQSCLTNGPCQNAVFHLFQSPFTWFKYKRWNSQEDIPKRILSRFIKIPKGSVRIIRWRKGGGEFKGYLKTANEIKQARSKEESQIIPSSDPTDPPNTILPIQSLNTASGCSSNYHLLDSTTNYHFKNRSRILTESLRRAPRSSIRIPVQWKSWVRSQTSESKWVWSNINQTNQKEFLPWYMYSDEFHILVYWVSM